MTVEPYGRLFYRVSSRTRKELAHFVDFEHSAYGPPPQCSCEKARLRLEDCHHILSAIAYMEKETLANPKIGERVS